jgi:NADPH-dependent ferric siderophore reductase
MKDRLLKALPEALRAIPPLTGTVIAREELAPSIMRFRARGEEFKQLGPFERGQHLDVLVHRAWPIGGRHYTPCYIDRVRGEIELIIHLHGNGPGSRFFERLRQDDELTIWGPGGGFTLRKREHQPVFVGDETTIATWNALLDAVEDADGVSNPRLVLSVEHADQRAAADHLQCETNVVVRDGDEAPQALVVDAIEDLIRPDDAIYYLAGRIRTIQAVRAFLRQDGVALNRIRPKGFWTEGRKGL